MPRERNACRAAPGRAAALLASLVACALAGGCATSGAGREAPKTELLTVPSADGEAARLYLADLAEAIRKGLAAVKAGQPALIDAVMQPR